MLVGLGVAGLAIGGRVVLRAWKSYKGGAIPPGLGPASAFKAFPKGGFLAQMDRKEAAAVLGIRYVISPPL